MLVQVGISFRLDRSLSFHASSRVIVKKVEALKLTADRRLHERAPGLQRVCRRRTSSRGSGLRRAASGLFEWLVHHFDSTECKRGNHGRVGVLSRACIRGRRCAFPLGVALPALGRQCRHDRGHLQVFSGLRSSRATARLLQRSTADEAGSALRHHAAAACAGDARGRNGAVTGRTEAISTAQRG